MPDIGARGAEALDRELHRLTRRAGRDRGAERGLLHADIPVATDRTTRDAVRRIAEHETVAAHTAGEREALTRRHRERREHAVHPCDALDDEVASLVVGVVVAAHESVPAHRGRDRTAAGRKVGRKHLNVTIGLHDGWRTIDSSVEVAVDEDAAEVVD